VGAEAEQYRYDINFRSTSNTDADEFIVEDPLESVRQGQVYLTGLWTPAVWGDQDGRFNVWYKTRNGSGNSAALPNPAITTVADPVYPSISVNGIPLDGWKLWTTVDHSDKAQFINDGVI